MTFGLIYKKTVYIKFLLTHDKSLSKNIIDFINSIKNYSSK